MALSTHSDWEHNGSCSALCCRMCIALAGCIDFGMCCRSRGPPAEGDTHMHVLLRKLTNPDTGARWIFLKM